MLSRLSLPLAAVLALSACDRAPTDPAAHGTGAVYALSNAAAGNSVIQFERAGDGSLRLAATFATGGAGTGRGLGSQGAVTLSRDGRWLLAVDAGSSHLTAFRVTGGGLVRTAHVASGGATPTSVTENDGLVYVLNAGAAQNITGFRLSAEGGLAPIAGSTQGLGAGDVAAAQVQFSPAGDQLVVTARATSQILTFQVDGGGRAGAARAQASAGTTPFGFAFAGPDRLVVSEAFGGAALASATSSYRLSPDGALTPATRSSAAQQTAACWVAVTPDGRFAYVANAGSGSITAFSVAADGRLTLVGPAAGQTGDGSGPADVAISADGRFLYVRNGGAGTVGIFAIGADGSLTPLGAAAGLPAGAYGLAAR